MLERQKGRKQLYIIHGHIGLIVSVDLLIVAYDFSRLFVPTFPERLTEVLAVSLRTLCVQNATVPIIQ